jgi:hypothetical protein
MLLNTFNKMATLDNVKKSDTKIPIPILEPTLKAARKPTRDEKTNKTNHHALNIDIINIGA